MKVRRRGENHPRGKVIRTTLGDLIVTVTDEVMRFIGKPLGAYAVASVIVSDLLAQNQVRIRDRSRRKYPKYSSLRTYSSP
jgi:hypothetical protein